MRIIANIAAKAQIRLGRYNVVEDCVHIEALAGYIRTGDYVVFGHGARVRGENIAFGNNVLVGMGAQVNSNVTVGNNVFIVGGAVVPEGAVIPDNCLYIKEGKTLPILPNRRVVLGVKDGKQKLSQPLFTGRWSAEYYHNRFVPLYENGLVKIDSTSFPRALLIGDITFSENTVIEVGTIIRSELNKINIEDAIIGRDCVFHAEPQELGNPHCFIKSGAVVGDDVVAHVDLIGVNALVGRGVVMTPHTEVGEGAHVQPYSVLAERTHVPDYSVYAGKPAKDEGIPTLGREKALALSESFFTWHREMSRKRFKIAKSWQRTTHGRNREFWIYPLRPDAWGALTDDDKIIAYYFFTRLLQRIGALYRKQIQEEGGIANFPITAAMIEEAQDPRIAQVEYACVEGKFEGRAVEIPYCVAYKQECQEIAGIFEELASLVEDTDTREYLLAHRDAFLWNRWEDKNRLWLTKMSEARQSGTQAFGGSQLLFYAGPYELTSGTQKSRRLMQVVCGIYDAEFLTFLEGVEEFLESFMHAQGLRLGEEYPDYCIFTVLEPFYAGPPIGAQELPPDEDIQQYLCQACTMFTNLYRDWAEDTYRPNAEKFLAKHQYRRYFDPKFMYFYVLLVEIAHSNVAISYVEDRHLHRAFDEPSTRFLRTLYELYGEVAFMQQMSELQSCLAPDQRRGLYVMTVLRAIQQFSLYLNRADDFLWPYVLGKTSLLDEMMQRGLLRIENGRFHLVFDTPRELARF
ncbi:hypothetical protein ACFL38_05585, partial [Candidatus Omnitrophota bacterium]